MATTKFKTKLINLKALAEHADVSIHKLYNRRHSETKKPLDLVDKTKLLNTLTKEVAKFSKDLGFTVEINLQENQER